MPVILAKPNANGDGPPKDIDIEIPTPLTRIELRDVASKGTQRFLHAVDISSIVQDAVRTVHKILTPRLEGTPNVRSITLVLRDFAGVAYTTGKDIDFEHKEIHFSTSYIEDQSEDRIADEITGVIVHEMVHVWQWNGAHECPGGLIEGIADWVRLKADLAPPHWKKRCKDCDWDSGYDVTGYFLEWLDAEYGPGTVVRLNQTLREPYEHDAFWPALFPECDVHALWKRYKRSIEGDENPPDGDQDSTGT